MSREELLLYYERELRFIRKLATDFAKKYPEVAGRLLLEPTKCEDPHVERLIEAFSMLTARVHQRLDADLAEISDALLGILYPHYLAPVPSATIVQLQVDPSAGAVEGGFRVDAHALLHSRPVAGVSCTFRTAYPLRLFPLEIAKVEIVGVNAIRNEHPDVMLPPETQSGLRIALRTQGGVPVAELGIDSLRFFLDAGSGDIHSLYELFLRDPAGVLISDEGDRAGVCLPPTSIRPVGFERAEGLFEYPVESFVGYRLLQEYFAFPDKFLFVELCDLGAGTRRCEGESVELFVLQKQSPAQLDLRVEREQLKLGCTPAVNLFPHHADPIRLTHASVEYAIQPDARAPDAYEVHSIKSVSASASAIGGSRTYAPFYGIRHGAADATPGAYWHAARRESLRKDDAGTDMFLSLVDEQFDISAPPTDVLHVELLCTNRGLPALLPFGDSRDFQLEGRPGITSIVALRKPTDPLSPPVGSASRWRLISHLTLNYLSLTGTADGRATDRGDALSALREILRLYDFADSPVTRQRIAGLVGLRTRTVVRRAGRGAAAGFARGVEAELDFDPMQYTGAGLFLFASVLERFLGLYTSVNSFTQTVARVRQRPGELKRWPPRAGEIQLL